MAKADDSKKAGKAEETKEELSPEEKAAKAEKNKLAQAKAKELLTGYATRHRTLLGAGLFMNLIALVGEFVTPLFIGKVIDAIVKADYVEVNKLVIWWMIFNAVSYQICLPYIYVYSYLIHVNSYSYYFYIVLGYLWRFAKVLVLPFD